MARPREFDIDIALDRAMQTFWSNGYDGTSLDDLCLATGLGRSSLYGAFGDKHALLLRSLDRYEELGLARINAALERPVPVRDAISGFIDDLIDKIIDGSGRRGCFVGNCTAELGRQDSEVNARVRRSMGRVEATFKAALIRAQERKEINKKTDVAAVARFLVAGIQGLRLVGKANPDRKTLKDIQSVILNAIS